MSDLAEGKRPLEKDDYVLSRHPDGSETVEGPGGESYEVVRSEPQRDSPTPSQARKIGEIYIWMAKELPTEGRDYTVSFEFPDPNGAPRIMLKPITKLGHDYVRHLTEAMAAKRKEQKG